MKAVVVKAAHEPFVLKDRSVPEPGPSEVRVKVHACGICYEDAYLAEALWPDLTYPRVPGHEVAGVVDALGPGVTHIQKGLRVGIGWYGGHDGTCRSCQSGDFILCDHPKVCGLTFDGGYAEYLIAPVESLARIPEGMSFTHAAPLLCAGITTYNALRHSGAQSGDVVAVQGLGGLGHLGVQFARAMGFETVVLSRGEEKKSFAHDLGAHHFINVQKEDIKKALGKFGGARVILATSPDSQSMATLVPGLSPNGCLLLLGVSNEPMPIRPLDLISRRASILGWPSGTAADSTDALNFAQLHGIRPMIETFPLHQAYEAYQKMLRGEVRFRAVLEMVSSA